MPQNRMDPSTVACTCKKKFLMLQKILCFLLVTVTNYLPQTRCCGTSTHIQIAHESLQLFKSSSKYKTDYSSLLRKHQDAFVAGNPYPDAMYPSLCFGGKYHGIAEDTHWAPFLNASVNYIRKRYPPPWTEDTEKLVAFVFGFVSHQIADVNWHSLGIDQGFLQTMGYMNFHGNYGKAHNTGDAGGDMVSLLEGDDAPIPLKKWYVPTKDLEEIYYSYYGSKRVTRQVIKDCSLLLYVEWVAEKIGGAKLYPFFAKKSPFLVEQLHSYYLGGIHDMAAWTTLLWNTTALMLEEGTEVCSIPKNPLYILCKDKKFSVENSERNSLRNPGKKKLDLNGLKSSDIQVTETSRGHSFSPGPQFPFATFQSDLNGMSPTPTVRVDKYTKDHWNATSNEFFTTHGTYSELGSSFIQWQMSPKHNYVIIGAPQAGKLGEHSSGAVFAVPIAVFRNSGNRMDARYLEEYAYKILDGLEIMSRFGTSLTVLDFNRDGIEDLAVGAPSVGAKVLMYSGVVYIYYGRENGIQDTPDVTILGTEKYNNFGYRLSSFDCNSDGFNDLIVSSPFSPNGGRQRGGVYVFFSHTYKSGAMKLIDSDADILIPGKYNYQWFGYSVAASTIGKLPLLVIGAPGSRRCAKTSCDFDEKDNQEIGRIYIYGLHNKKQPVLFSTINGTSDFSKLGFSMSVGDPFGVGGKTILAVGGPSGDAKGHVAGLVPVTYIQAGNVFLYDLEKMVEAVKGNRIWDAKPIAEFSGDRHYGRFGWMVEFAPFSHPDLDDLFIGHPYRSRDITGVLYGGEEGAVYRFQGGKNFVVGDVTRDCGYLTDSPCPYRKATFFEFGNEARARFGTSISVLAHETKRNLLLVGAPRSSLGSFHGGTIITINNDEVDT